ncbi:MAG TPA: hypothetical protein VJ872_03810 [Nocardioides sp.]|nr:hypothetical protein [Nocardioides sp.]
MTAADDERDPWWQVIAVFGHDVDQGSDFAYTVGLAERGLPELHVLCRPSEGEDPAHDWRFSMRDMGRLLNEVAWRLVDGRLSPGDTWTEQYDAGLVEARFRLDPAVEAEELEAFQAHPAPVHPLRWSLHRKPMGPLTPLTPDAEGRAWEELGALTTQTPMTGAIRGVPTMWAVPAVPSWDPTQRWGPRTPLVAASASRLVHCSVDELIDLVNLTFALEVRHLSAYPLVVARSAARDVGRSSALERLEDDVRDLVAGLGTAWAEDAWSAALAWVDDDEDEPFPPERLKEMLGLVITSHLATVAVADRLEVDDVIAGIGPLSVCFESRGVSPDDRWHAAPHVVDAVAGLVRTAGARATVDAALAWQRQEDEATAEARGSLAVMACRSASTFPPFMQACGGMAGQLVATLAEAEAPGWVVQEWLSAIATLVTHRALLGNEVAEPVLLAGAALMPGLLEVVNQPLAP